MWEVLHLLDFDLSPDSSISSRFHTRYLRAGDTPDTKWHSTSAGGPLAAGVMCGTSSAAGAIRLISGAAKGLGAGSRKSRKRLNPSRISGLTRD